MSRLSSRLALCTAVAGLSLLASSAFAKTPSNLEDLVYQDAAWGEQQMRSRGYTIITSDLHNGSNVEYWWDNRHNTCVRTKEVNGKYEVVKTTPATDCNQYQKSATKGNSAAGAAVAAAAILGVAALASKSHHRDDKYADDSNATAEFDRGYRDGLHSKGYHNYDDTTAYSNGYNQGRIERDEETHYHSNSGHHSGNAPYVKLHDMVGMKASSADSEFRSRGFSDMGGYKQGNKSIVTWWNARTRQCVNSITKNGRIKDIDKINVGNCT